MYGCSNPLIFLTIALFLGGAISASSQTDQGGEDRVAVAPAFRSDSLEVADRQRPQHPFQAFGRAPDVVFLQPNVLLRNSEYGQLLQGEYDEARAAVALDNRRKGEALEVEEAMLADLKNSGYAGPASFAILSAAFDRKVSDIREQQDAKATQLELWTERYRGWFFWFAQQVALREVIARERLGAVVGVADAWHVPAWLDITDLLIQEVDRTLGDGSSSSNHLPLAVAVGLPTSP